MGKMEEILKNEIRRLVRRELRGSVTPLGKDVRELKRTVAQLVQTVARLEKVAKTVERERREKTAKLQVPAEEVESSRMSPGLIKKLRQRFDLTQADLAALVGVSTPAVVFWESGRSSPRGENRTALVALRKLGKRDVQALLEEKGRPAKKRRRKRAVKK